MEVPITNEKPKYYQFHDINSLIHNVTHTYQPEITQLFLKLTTPHNIKMIPPPFINSHYIKCI